MTLDDSIAAREPLPRHRSLFAAFVGEVRERFGFLAGHGWREHQARWPLVDYRTPATSLAIWLRPARDNEHFFLDLYFQVLSNADTVELISLHEVAANAVSGHSGFPANNRAEIAGSLDMAGPRAHAAFKVGEWATVVHELEPFADRLKRSDRLKLDYARRRL